MRSDCFLDTNILIYAAAAKQDEPRKFAIAAELVTTSRFGVSAQTLGEFYNVATRRLREPLSPAEVDAWIEVLSERPFTPVDARLVRVAISVVRNYHIRYYDAALIAAAERLEAPIFYSEDLNHGQFYGSVQVINPFLKA